MIKQYSILIGFNNKSFFILGFFLFFYSLIYSQDQKNADSLELMYNSGDFKEENRLKILEELADNLTDLEKQLNYSNELIELAIKLDSTNYLWYAFILKGTALRNKGDYNNALKCHIKAAEIAMKKKHIKNLGKSYISIGDVYSEMGNHNNSIKYYNYAIDILRKENDSDGTATALYNAGDEYYNIRKFDSALIYFSESYLIFKKKNKIEGTAYNLGSMGMIYAEKGNYNLAKQNINKAIKYLEQLKDYVPISEFLITMSNIYIIQNDFTTSLNYAHRSLEIAQKYGLKKQISESNYKLSDLYERKGDMDNSLKYFKNFITYRDSVKNLESIQQMADLRTNFEVSQKQDEITSLEKEAIITELKAKRQKIMNIASASAALLILLLTISYYRRYKFSKKTNGIIEEEKNRSQKLLLNILPKKTALELIHQGKVKAKKFDLVSVMFTDFKNFTSYSDNLSPDELVNSVDFYYSKFDEIIEKYGLEKIKTIGDSYMCAGGLPFSTADHAEKIIMAAFEIAEFMEKTRKLRDEHVSHFDIRIGVNSGPVVAGVVGKTKFAYDIWGNTVNVASRMESNSKPGKINISENTYELIKDKFNCTFRGEIQVKNKGMMKMYFVKGIKKVETIEISRERNVKV